MKYLVLAASVALLGPPFAIAQSKGTCASPVEIPAQSGMSLTIDSISSEVDIVGADQNSIRVSCTLPDGDSKEVHIRAERTGAFGKIAVSGGPSHNLHIRIEVPRQTSFRLRMAAGQVKVNDVSGDKDIHIQAGQVIVSSVDSTQYHSVHASVDIGDVRVAAFGADKGGFFRSFDRDTAGGPYRLRVHIMTGSVELN